MKILIADDNITAQNLGKKILSEAGYEVVAVSNGAAAMKKIASEKPQILILDVYMPGYSGLEVCQKVKGAAETAKVPVLLAIGQMEAFSAEEGNKVKADGVINKPFIASDLLAVVEKFAEKMQSAKATGKAEKEYERTVKMPAMPDSAIQDATYEAWKAEAAEAELVEAAPEPARLSMSQEMGAAPALMDEMLVYPDSPHGQSVMAAAAAASPDFSAAKTQEQQSADSGLEFQPESEAIPMVEIPMVTAPGVEFTSAPKASGSSFERAPELMTEEPPTAEIPITVDPALLTDRSQMATEFATKFGEANPEEITVGVAGWEFSAFSAVAEAPASPAVSEPEASATDAGLATAETRQVFEAPGEASPSESTAAAFAVPQEPALPPLTPEVAPAGEVTSKLVEQFAAELDRVAAECTAQEPEPAPAVPAVEAAPAISDEQRVSEAAARVLERVKPDLIAEILRELKKN